MVETCGGDVGGRRVGETGGGGVGGEGVEGTVWWRRVVVESGGGV